MKRLIQLLFVCLFLISCNDDDEQEPIDVQAAEILVLNEGNFGFGNASISLYNRESGAVRNKLFQANNLGRPIGDVLQSTIRLGDKLFLVVNNSSKIEVVDVATFRSIGNIAPLNSPRYILPIDSSTAYVSDLYEDKIYVIDYTLKQVCSIHLVLKLLGVS